MEGVRGPGRAMPGTPVQGEDARTSLVEIEFELRIVAVLSVAIGLPLAKWIWIAVSFGILEVRDTVLMGSGLTRLRTFVTQADFCFQARC